MIFIDVTMMATEMIKRTVRQMFKFSLILASSCLCEMLDSYDFMPSFR